MITPFPHKLTSENVQEMNGFIQCLAALQTYIAEETQYNPDRRYIDSVQLLEKIQATSEDLQPLFAQALKNIFSINFKTYTDGRNN